MSRQNLHDLSQHVRQREISAVDLVKETLSRIESLDARLNCFREVLHDDAITRAHELDRRLNGGEAVGRLAGVPIAVKDNIATIDGHTTCGSRFLESYRSPFNATAVQRLLDAGAIIIGRTNCDEFAMGSSTEHSAFGVTHNPWDASRVPGGSSGGSAAAVAAEMVPAAIGSDTGGSVRQPAAMCGVVGLKPTYGRISRYGLVAFGSSLDQIGPLAGSVADAAMLLEVMAAVDPRDATSADVRVPDYLERIDEPVQDLRVGVPEAFLGGANDESVNRAVQNAVGVFEDLGATVVPVSLPTLEHGICAYYIIAPAEASANLARFDGVRYGRRAALGPADSLDALFARSRTEGFGDEVKRRIILGTYVLSGGYYEAYYRRAQQVRRLIKRDFDEAFGDCDVILGPTTPTPAFPIGAITDPLTMYQCDLYTVPANLAGICAISLPAGFDERSGRPLPIGIQLQGQVFDESRLLRVARMFEQATAPGVQAIRPGTDATER